MEDNKGKLKLIHIILLGCIFLIGTVCGVIYVNVIGQIDASANIANQDEIIKISNTNIKEENKEYFSKDVEVPKTSKVTKRENCKTELTLKDSKIDNDKLILNFEANTKNNPIKNINNVNIGGIAKLEIGNEIYCLDNIDTNILKMIEIGENLYEIYAVYDLEGLEYDKNIKFIANICISEFDDYFADIDIKYWDIGDWDIELALSKEMKTEYNEKYTIENLIVETDEGKRYGDESFEIFKASVLEENVIINVLLTGYSTEPGILYKIEILDDQNNSLMLDGKDLLIGGIRQDILLKKFDLDSKIKVKFEVSGYGTNEIFGQGERVLKISDYVNNFNNTNPIIEKAYNKDLELSYDSTKFKLETTNAYVEVEYENLQYPINVRVVDDYVYSRDITINKYENKFNESLNEIFENRQKLQEMSIFGEKTEEYTIGVDVGPYDEWGSPADVKFYKFTDAEVMDMYNGKTVTKEGVEFDKEKFSEHSKDGYGGFDFEYKNFGEVTINGMDAITFVTDTNGYADRSYIVIVDNYIYEIQVPTDLKLEDSYYDVVNSITFKR